MMSVENAIECFVPFDVGPSWQRVLQEEWEKPYVLELASFLEGEWRSGVPIYPPKELVFNALKHTAFEDVKVVIVGQDPYHGPGQAHGLSFSVPRGVPVPPSLKNIYKELASDVGFTVPTHGCLIPWANQGVLLLNATLSVKQGDPMSHHGKGWELFTNAVIRSLAKRQEPVIFVLWGSSARKKCEHVDEIRQNSHHRVLKSPHPSPLSASRGFFGCRHFSKINEILNQMGKTPINWAL